MKTYKLAVLNSHPIQYFAPLYRRLAKEETIDLTVYYCSRQGVEEYLDPGFGQTVKWDIPLLEGYRYKFLPNLRATDHLHRFAGLVNPGILGEIGGGRFDAVWLHGHRYVSDWLAVAAAQFARTPVFYRSESSPTYDAYVHRPFYVRLAKPPLLRFLFSRVSRFLAIGTLNRAYYQHYGVRPEKIFHVPYAVDNAYFESKSEAFRAKRNDFRSAIGIDPNDAVFLFAAKMIPGKSPLELLRAYQQLSDISQKALIMAGDGHLRSVAEEYARQNNLPKVHFVGFVNQSELPKYYAMSDVFVRPDAIAKGDWGLTVNEAMASGLAVISANLIGAVPDLVRNGENGFAFQYGDTDDLSRAMRRMLKNPEACRKMGARSKEIIGTWSYEECVRGILEALHSLKEPR